MSAETFEDLADDFAFLENWEDRYRYVIDLGKEMPAMDGALKSGLTKVDGCASQVWIAPQIAGEGEAARLRFVGDSDAMIVRGLIAVLKVMLNDKRPTEILQIDAPAKLAELGLDQALSPQRSNGLRAMVVRIRELAAAAAD